RPELENLDTGSADCAEGTFAGAVTGTDSTVGAFFTSVTGVLTGISAGAPSVEIIAIALPTGITSPSLHSFFSNIPSDGAGISESTLSVAISNSVSSAFTLSPSFLSHLIIVASITLSPILGITISVCAIAVLK